MRKSFTTGISQVTNCHQNLAFFPSSQFDKEREYKGEYEAIVKGIVEKLHERLPLKHHFVQSLFSLVPKNVTESKYCPSKFEKVVHKLCTVNHINSKKADNAKLQLEEFQSQVKFQSQAQLRFIKISFLALAMLKSFGSFFHEYLKGNKYKDLWEVMVIVFTISHGQSQIEK